MSLCIALLTGCNPPEQYFVFGTFLEIDLSGVGTKTEKKIIDRLTEIDALMSATLENSDISRINRAAAGESVSVSAETLKILTLCREMYDETGGAFNPALRPLVALWGFTPELFTIAGSERKPPAAEEITETSSLCGFSREDFKIDAEAGTVTKRLGGAGLDLGAVVKGYAASEAAATALAANKKADGIINLGGNIYAVGGKQNIGIGNPRPSAAPYLGALPILGCIATSGDYQRYYTYENEVYSHIIDGRTGYPAKSGIISVSVICEDGALADMLSTAVFVLGGDKGAALLARYGADAVFVFEDGTYALYGADGFTLKDTGYTERLLKTPR
ncbi:MAG: FAD:protein FMN transferase [Clostridiales bacterium]|nr:FAD:protein FMN transferase [Clostridiales bacterium]